VSFPFVILLIIPGVMYGRILVGTSRKLNEAYNIAGNIAEQALSSIRTVFAFVGEERTMTKFSDALNVTVKLGLKQGLVKGLAVGSGGLAFVSGRSTLGMVADWLCIMALAEEGFS
jgi:ATP-binding cassette subfamily B (MDR/TAP) protein 1